MEIDAMGVFNMCAQSFPALKASGRGTIINISAMFQKRYPPPLHSSPSVADMYSCFLDRAAWYQTHATAAKAFITSLLKFHKA